MNVDRRYPERLRPRIPFESVSIRVHLWFLTSTLRSVRFVSTLFQPSDPQIRPVRAADRLEWLRLRMALWPEALPRELEEELDATLADSARQAVFGWARGCGLGGMLEATLRPFAEGCSSSPVAYVEGWYVDPDLRRRRVGSRLMAAFEEWAQAAGCLEAASDAAIENATSYWAHTAAGFEEAARVIHFKKRLE